MLRKLSKSFLYAFRGLKYLWKEEQNFRIQIFIAIAVILLAFYFEFSYLELSLILVMIALVLSAEALNTIFEDTLNTIQPNFDPRIGSIKDMMASIVLIVSIGSLVVGLLIFWRHFGL